jgi:hypothetical protein
LIGFGGFVVFVPAAIFGIANHMKNNHETKWSPSKMQRSRFVLFLILMSGCGSSDLSYNLTENGCSTGEQSFSSREDYCKGLQNKELNHDCAYTLRRNNFKANCTGEFKEF